ncbi:MAG: hypothetical protein ACLP5H_28835 [Desulfomonilaceae bacterium]
MTNLAFELQKDKDWREDELFQPFKIVSLWKVLRFYSKIFFTGFDLMSRISTGIRLMAQLDRSLRDCGVTDADFGLRDLEELLPDAFEELLEAFKATDLGYAVMHVKRLLDYVKSPLDERNNNEFKQKLDSLMQMIVDEFEQRVVLVVPPSAVNFYEDKNTFLGKDTIEEVRFSLLIRDASEAGNCFALGRYTACVFHLMRIAEFMNQSFAKELGIKAIQTKKGPVAIEDAGWRIIYDHINNHINGTKTSPPLPDKALREKCNNLLSLIGPLREVRNPLMHSPGDFYTKENADTYMKCITSFINQFRTVF